MGNRHRERVSARAKLPSLLAGLLTFEDASRLIASHTVRNGVRYRYYRSPPDQAETPPARPISLAADALESAVTTALVRFLGDAGQMLNLTPGTTDPGRTLQRAARLATHLTGTESVARRSAVLELATTITLGNRLNHPFG